MTKAMDAEQKKKDTETLKLGCIALLSIAPLSALQGFVMQKCWAWFFTPLGLKEIGLVQALGVALTLSLFFPTNPPTQENGKEVDADKFWRNLLLRIAMPLVVWGIGYLYTLLM